MRRPIVLLLFATIFVSELGWAGIAPLLPTFEDRFGLSDPGTGLILSVASLGALVISLPAGALSRNFSVRTLTLWGTVALTVGNLATGLADGYPALLMGRCLAGVGVGMMWVTATAWLHEAAGERGAQALAFTITVAGAATLVGPAMTGVLAERYGTGMPFVLLGLLCAIAGMALFVARDRSGRTTEPSPPLRDMLRAAVGDDLLKASVLLSLVVSLMWLTVELLAPLRLHRFGWPSSKIGFAFAASSIALAVASAITARGADRYTTLRFSAVWTAILAAGLAFGSVASSAPGTVVFLLVIGAASGMMIAISYPLGAVGAREGGFSVAVVGALINMVWATSGILGPILGGWIAASAGAGPVYAILAAIATAIAAWVWNRKRAEDASTGAAAELD